MNNYVTDLNVSLVMPFHIANRNENHLSKIWTVPLSMTFFHCQTKEASIITSGKRIQTFQLGKNEWHARHR